MPRTSSSMRWLADYAGVSCQDIPTPSPAREVRIRCGAAAVTSRPYADPREHHHKPQVPFVPDELPTEVEAVGRGFTAFAPAMSVAGASGCMAEFAILPAGPRAARPAQLQQAAV